MGNCVTWSRDYLEFLPKMRKKVTTLFLRDEVFNWMTISYQATMQQ